MNDSSFIELSIKYLDAAASSAEVEQLNAAMLDNPNRRALYRDLVRQSQLAHEWQSSSTASHKTRRPITKLMLTAAGAAAAIILAVVALQFSKAPDLTAPPLADSGNELPDLFKGAGPSWQTLYPSIFDRPEFVWQAEFAANTSESNSLDFFTENGMPAALATSLEPEFSLRIEPIVMLPGGPY